ncbi:hypothetical protein AVEN_139263-1 [Araneus ventricosus]|uniref:Uncharacterized protein n=1 Tax=Araneus ventricosus TaxID=182803 RepID=A0A4Y2SK17_ARAVE|nr:hypothetical protein AVEN_139263-1 [Araneus ventricosus]
MANPISGIEEHKTNRKKKYSVAELEIENPRTKPSESLEPNSNQIYLKNAKKRIWCTVIIKSQQDYQWNSNNSLRGFAESHQPAGSNWNRLFNRSHLFIPSCKDSPCVVEEIQPLRDHGVLWETCLSENPENPSKVANLSSSSPKKNARHLSSCRQISTAWFRPKQHPRERFSMGLGPVNSVTNTHKSSLDNCKVLPSSVAPDPGPPSCLGCIQTEISLLKRWSCLESLESNRISPPPIVPNLPPRVPVRLQPPEFSFQRSMYPLVSPQRKCQGEILKDQGKLWSPARL